MSKLVKVLDDNPQRTGGVAGYITWQRLANQLLTQQEINDGKKVVQVEADQNGIKFIIEHS